MTIARLFLASIVCVIHIAGEFLELNPDFRNFGYLAVFIFFSISGYYIRTSALSNVYSTNIFLRRRIKRILPPLVVAALLTWAAALLANDPSLKLSLHIGAPFFQSLQMLGVIIFNFVRLEFLSPIYIDGDVFQIPYQWALIQEVRFYILIYLLLVTFRQQIDRSIILVTAIFILINALDLSSSKSLIYWNFFALGWFFNFLQNQALLHRWIVFSMFFCLNLVNLSKFEGGVVFMIQYLCLWLVTIAISRSVLGRKRFFTFDSSYGIYILSGPIILLGNAFDVSWTALVLCAFVVPIALRYIGLRLFNMELS